jgi:hypothetical protein
VLFPRRNGRNAAKKSAMRVSSVDWAGNSSWFSPMQYRISAMQVVQTGLTELHG